MVDTGLITMVEACKGYMTKLTSDECTEQDLQDYHFDIIHGALEFVYGKEAGAITNAMYSKHDL